MTRKFWLLFPVALVVFAAPLANEHFVSGAKLRSEEAELHKAVKDGLAGQPLGNWGNHTLGHSHRESTGQAELHEKQADILFIRSGAGSLVLGGKVVGGKMTAANEVRGTSIEGGEKIELHPGDVIHVPVRTAHQFVLAKGQMIDYLAVKVDQ